MKLSFYENGDVPEDGYPDEHRRMLIRRQKPSHREKSLTIVGAKRAIGSHDLHRFGTTIADRVSRLEDNHLRKIMFTKAIGATILTPDESKLIFDRQHSRGTSLRALKKYNYKFLQTIETANKVEPIVFAKLGEIGIFGVPEDMPGKRYIGPYIVDDAREVLSTERDRVINVLLPENAKPIYDRLQDNYAHHITFLSTNSETTAQRAADALASAGLTGSYVSLMPAQPIHREFSLDRSSYDLNKKLDP
ncbi:MAG: hypothetical protein NVS1B10_03770 [Candidatus Saccharimonadales bacterium]